MRKTETRRSLLLAVACLLIAWTACQADFNPKRWEFYRDLSNETGKRAEYGIAVLDRAIYGGSAPNLADLRVIGRGNREISYKTIEDRGSTETTNYQPRMLNKSDVKGRFNSLVLYLGKPAAVHNRVELHTSSKNFMYRVQVEGSEDGLRWATLRNDGYIFNFFRQYEASHTKVTYPDSYYPYIRVKVWHLNQPPINIQSATISREKKIQPVEELLAESKHTVQNTAEKSTDIILDEKCASLPGEKIVILSPDVNYSRQVVIAGSVNRKTWTEIGWGQIFKYNTPEIKAAESRIECSTEGYRYVRVRIRNYDDRPIRVSSVQLRGFRRRVFFLASAEGLRLYYGNSYAQTPVYDIEETFKYLRPERALPFGLGPVQKNPMFSRPFATGPWLERNPWALWAVLLAAVVLLGALIVRSAIQTRETPPSG